MQKTILLILATFMITNLAFSQEGSYVLVASKPPMGPGRTGCRIYNMNVINKRIRLLYESQPTTSSIESIAVEEDSRLIVFRGKIFNNSIINSKNDNAESIYDHFITEFIVTPDALLLATPNFIPAYPSLVRELFVKTPKQKVAIPVYSLRHDRLSSYYIPDAKYERNHSYEITCYEQSCLPTPYYQGRSLFAQELSPYWVFRINEDTGNVFRYINGGKKEILNTVDKNVLSFLSKRSKTNDNANLGGISVLVGYYSQEYALYCRSYSQESSICIENTGENNDWNYYFIPRNYHPMKKYGNIQVYQNKGTKPPEALMPVFGGKYLFHTIGTDTKEDFIWEVTPQTELLSINDGVVLYRVENSLYIARIEDKKIVDDQLILEAEDVENIHWAFQLKK